MGPGGRALKKDRESREIATRCCQMVLPIKQKSFAEWGRTLGGASGDGCGVTKPCRLRWQVELDKSPSLEEGCSEGRARAGVQGAACPTLSI